MSAGRGRLVVRVAIAALLTVCTETRAGLWGLPAGSVWDAPPEMSGGAPIVKKPFWRDGGWRVAWSAPTPSAGLAGYQLRVQGRLGLETAAGVREALLPDVPFSHRLIVEVRARFADGRVSPWSVQVERPFPPAPDAVAEVRSTVTTLHGGLQNLLQVAGADGVGFRSLAVSAAGTTPFGPAVLLPSNLEVGVAYDPFRTPVRSVSGSDWTPAQAPASWVDGTGYGYDLLLRSGTVNVRWLTLGFFLNEAAGRWVGGTVGTATFPMPHSPSFPRRWDVTVRVEQPVTGAEMLADALARFGAAPSGFGGSGAAFTSHVFDPPSGAWIEVEDAEYPVALASRHVARDAQGRPVSVVLRRGAVRASLAPEARAQWGDWLADGGARLVWAAETVLPGGAREFHTLTQAAEAVYAAPAEDGDVEPRLVAWALDVEVDPGQRALRTAGLVIHARRTLPAGGTGSVVFRGGWYDLCTSLTVAWTGPFACRIVDPSLAEAAWDAGSVLVPGQDLGPWLEALRNGSRRVDVRASGVGSGILTASAGCAGSVLQASCDLRAIAVPLLLPDADRDGGIVADLAGPDAALLREGRPWYFWLNDDNDTGLVRDNDVRPSQDSPGQPEGRRDCGNDVVDGLRDLVDFFPTLVDIAGWSPSGGGTRWLLSHADGAVGCVVTDAVPERAGRALAGHADCLQHATAAVVEATPAGWDITALLAGSGERRVLLLEGRRATREPLRLEAWEAGQMVAAVELPLHIGPVESMYRTHNFRRIPFVNNADPPGEDPGSTWPGGGGPPGFPDGQTDGTHFVAIHGLAFSLEEGRGFAADVFKRFFQSGCQAMFHAILWRSDEGSARPLWVLEEQALDYHINCTNAWVTGDAVHPLVAALDGPVTVFVHSLGSVVAGRALSLGRPAGFRRLITLNGSAPLAAFFPGEAEAYANVLRHPAWREIHPQFWASNWHRIFASSPGDARARLTWTGQFASIPNVDNIYSRWDQVLRVPMNDDFSLAGVAVHQDEEIWASQERLKGRYAIDLVRLLPGVAWRSDHGGWGFNRAWYVEQRVMRRPKQGGPRWVRRLRDGLHLGADEGGVALAALATSPLFRPFDASDARYVDPATGASRYNGAALLAPPGSAAASDAASDSILVGKLLAECIPNLGAALGGVPSSGDAPLAQGLDYCAIEPFWSAIPDSRRHVDGTNRYLHSDYLNLPYAYTYFVFQRALRGHSP